MERHSSNRAIRELSCWRTKDGIEVCLKDETLPRIDPADVAWVSTAQCLLKEILRKRRKDCPEECPVKALIFQ